MNFPLEGPKLKIERAYQKLAELKAVEEQFFKINKPRLDIDVDSETGERSAVIRLDENLPGVMRILPGEIIYHLRSALDLTAVALGRMSAKKPNIKEIHFPTGDSHKGFGASCRQRLEGFDPDLITLVEGFKAFDGEGGDFALRAVCRISNVDKHLELVPVAPSGIMNYLSCYTIEDAPGPFNFLGGLASLKDGIMLCRLGLNGTITPNSPDAQIGVAGRIILGRVSIYEGQPLLPFLSGLVDRVRDAYNQIVHHLHDTGRI